MGRVGTAAAIANTVLHAPGPHLRGLPLTLDKVLAGLAQGCRKQPATV